MDEETINFGMNKYERQRLLNDQVCARNDFNATDERYFANTGRTIRVRPPGLRECQRAVQSLQILGYTPFVIVHRDLRNEAMRLVALFAVDGELAQTLPVELAMMGDDATFALLRKKEVKWWPL